MPTVRLATTPAEIEMALKLRYSVFFVEGGDARYADHERQVWTDRDDGPQSHLLIAVDDSENMIGTVRVTVLRDWQFIGHEAYRLDVLAAHIGIPLEELRPRIARLDRVVVAKEFRGTEIFPLLFLFAEEITSKHECDILIGVAVRSVRLWEKKGCKPYSVVSTHAGFTAQPLFKLLHAGPAQELEHSSTPR